jgi:hypothetical protein
MTLDESVHGMRLHVIECAQVHGHVSTAWREMRIPRTVFYRWRKRLERDGVDGVHPAETLQPTRHSTGSSLFGRPVPGGARINPVAVQFDTDLGVAVWDQKWLQGARDREIESLVHFL